MGKKTKKRLQAFLLGLLIGAGIVAPFWRYAREEAGQWRAQWERTRDAWLEDRRNWRDGKPFEPHYSRHHIAW